MAEVKFGKCPTCGYSPVSVNAVRCPRCGESRFTTEIETDDEREEDCHSCGGKGYREDWLNGCYCQCDSCKGTGRRIAVRVERIDLRANIVIGEEWRQGIEDEIVGVVKFKDLKRKFEDGTGSSEQGCASVIFLLVGIPIALLLVGKYILFV
jgi:hypothetical protein